MMTVVRRQLRLAQDRDTGVHHLRSRFFRLRYAYARSAESRAVGDASQDYLVMDWSGSTLVFALCDGVSQSFFGGLAARYLGDGLVDWLAELAIVPTDEAALAASLGRHLGAMTARGTLLVRRQELPAGPSLLLDVLEEKRARGSESTFVGVRIDIPGPELPAGRLLMCWMGDSRLRLWSPGAGAAEAEVELAGLLGDTFITHERWSTRSGVVGDRPHARILPLRDQTGSPRVVRCMTYSDGLASLDGIASPPSDAALLGLIAESQEDPASDDISFLEVGLR